MITLYDATTAPSPRRARIILAEKGVPHENVQVDLPPANSSVPRTALSTRSALYLRCAPKRASFP